jgi:hypothetical protein
MKDFKVGDKVLVPAIIPDWFSLEAQRGYAMHSGSMLGGCKFSNIKDGVFAEYFHENDADANLALLPKGMVPQINQLQRWPNRRSSYETYKWQRSRQSNTCRRMSRNLQDCRKGC